MEKYKTKIVSIKRNELLVPNKGTRVSFVSTFGPCSKQVANVIRKHWPLLTKGCPDVVEFQTPPILAQRRDRDLRDILVKNDNGPRTVSQTSFLHPQMGQTFPIKARDTCSSSFVIYVIICPCGLYYIGETTMEVRAQINKHKSTIRLKQIDVPVAAHFVTMGHSVSQLKFKVIDGVAPLRHIGYLLLILCPQKD